MTPVFKKGMRIVSLPGTSLPGTARALTPPPPLPPLRKQLANVAQAVVDNVKQLAKENSPLIAKEEKQQARSVTCEGCEYFRPNDYRCSECGCNLKVKISLEASKCPKGKW